MSKKMLIGFAVLMLAAFVLVGCGQQNPTINTSNPQPQGLKIKGVVRTTTLNGTVGNPIQGAVVALSGDSANRTAVTNAQGEYLFENVPDGNYIFVATAEGHTRLTTAAITIKPTSNIPADNTISVADITLGSRPIVLSITPVPNSVVANRPTFVVTFNEAMDTTTVVPALTATGVRVFVSSGTTVPLTITWDTVNKVLTAVPQADLISNEAYNFAINTGALDTAGYQISAVPEQALALSQSFRVSTGGIPGVPANLVVSFNAASFTNEAAGVDFNSAIIGGATLGINWSPSTGIVTGYRIYLADSATGVYHLYTTATATTNYIFISMTNIMATLYGGTAVLDPLGTFNWPLINKSLYVKVVAFNGDGESTAASASVKELVGPRIDNTTYKKYGFAGVPVIEDGTNLPAIGGTNNRVVYIALLEPVQRSTITASNFSITAGGGTSVVSATLLTQGTITYPAGWAGGSGNEHAFIKIETSADMTALTTITMGAGILDLAGNPVKAGQGDTITLAGF